MFGLRAWCVVPLMALIERAISLKRGNQEFILYRFGPHEWVAGIGNPNEHVLMFEVEPEIQGKGDTAAHAVANLIVLLKRRSA